MSSIFAFILLLNAVLASPSVHHSQVTESSVSVSDSGRIHATGEIDADEARGNLMARQTIIENTIPMPMTCNKVLCFVVVGIGTPPNNYSLMVDTASPQTFVGAKKPFVSTSSTSPTGQNISIVYNGNTFSGHEVLDIVTLAPDLVVNPQSILIVNETADFVGLDGALGLARFPIISGIPTEVQNLQTQGLIQSRIFGILSQPPGLSDAVPGTIFFGGTDSSNLTSEIEFFPITQSTVGGANRTWALEMDVTYGTSDLLSNGVVLMNPSKTGIVMAADVFQHYQEVTGADFDDESGLLVVTLDQTGALLPLNFTVLGHSYSLSANAQIRPRAPDQDFDRVFLIPTPNQASSKETFGVVLGTAFASYFFTAYDDQNGLVGIATTTFTDSAVN